MARSELTLGKGIATWVMTVAGGELPDKYEAKIAVTCEYGEGNLDWLAEVAFSGSSARVRLQSQLRTWGTVELNKLQLEGFKCTATGIRTHAYNKGSKGSKPVDYKAALRMLPFEERVKRLMADLGVDEEMAKGYAAKLEQN